MYWVILSNIEYANVYLICPRSVAFGSRHKPQKSSFLLEQDTDHYAIDVNQWINEHEKSAAHGAHASAEI